MRLPWTGITRLTTIVLYSKRHGVRRKVVDGQGRRKRRRSSSYGAQIIASTRMDVYHVDIILSTKLAFKFTSETRNNELVLPYRVRFFV
jgi:hypothetical protein